MLIPLAALLLCQASANPDIKKAEAKLAEKPDDPAANLALGKLYLPEEPDKAIPHLVKGSDAALKAAAASEEKASQGALFALESGDLWSTAMSRNKPIRQACLDRANFWYAKAWPDLGEVYKIKLRERLLKLYLPGAAGKGKLPEGLGGANLVPSGARVHSGASALRVSPPKGNGGLVDLGGIDAQVPKGTKFEFSAWFSSEGSTGTGDKLQIELRDSQRKAVWIKELYVTPDMPIWVKVGAETPIPDGVMFFRVAILTNSTAGAFWIDDLSAKVDGKEILKGGGFE